LPVRVRVFTMSGQGSRSVLTAPELAAGPDARVEVCVP
jgi:hypothetical protein